MRKLPTAIHVTQNRNGSNSEETSRSRERPASALLLEAQVFS